MSITVQQVLDALKYVDDPDLKKDLVTLNMIKDVAVDGKNISFTVVLTTPACPMKDMIHNACVNAILHYVDKEAKVDVTMSSNVTTKKEKDETTLRDVKNIIAVASGKGGVGKSTIAANLALGLAKQGARVGLVDADIYGPSQHIMFGVENENPGPAEFMGQKKMAPVESFGVKLNSIGFMAGPGQVVALRLGRTGLYDCRFATGNRRYSNHIMQPNTSYRSRCSVYTSGGCTCRCKKRHFTFYATSD
jgi:ATP-binding protein involved in chromosome partitioning